MVGPSKQANIHTHGCNEVTLVWGSLAQARPNYVILRKNIILWLLARKSNFRTVQKQRMRTRHYDDDNEEAKEGWIGCDERGCWQWYHYWCVGHLDMPDPIDLSSLQKKRMIHNVLPYFLFTYAFLATLMLLYFYT